jgi:hypothetical protein
MKKLKGCLGVFVIFFLGVFVGVAITIGGVHEHVQKLVEGGPDQVVDVVVNRLKKELKLDEAQQVKLQQIVAGTRIKLRQIHERSQPEIEHALSAAENEVRGILYAEQVKKFEEIVRKGRKKWKYEEQVKAIAVPGESEPADPSVPPPAADPAQEAVPPQ